MEFKGAGRPIRLHYHRVQLTTPKRCTRLMTPVLGDVRQRVSTGFARSLCGFVHIFWSLSGVSKPYYPQYAAPYAGAFRRIWRFFQGLSRDLFGGFVRPLQGLENLCFILSSALSRFSRLFGHFLHFLSLSLKISCTTCKTFKRTFSHIFNVFLGAFLRVFN